MRRLASILGAFLLVVTMAAWAPPARTSGGGPLGQGNGYVNQRWWQHRQDGYLDYATQLLDRTSPTNVLAFAARAARDRSFHFDLRSIRPSDFQGSFDKIDGFQDTSDFDLLHLVALWEGYQRKMAPDLRAAIKQRMLGFRYWYTDPLPAGVIDNKWFWTENHRIIMHMLEYLSGRALAHERFTITGLSGRVRRTAGSRANRAMARREGPLRFLRMALRRLLPGGHQALTLWPNTPNRRLPGVLRPCSTCSCTTSPSINSRATTASPTAART